MREAFGRDASILFLYSRTADPYLTHATSIKTFAAAYARRGISAVTLDMTAPDFGPQFGRIVTQPHVIAVHCEQGWGLDIAVDGGGGRAVDPYVALNKPAMAHIRDYPFYPWLRQKTFPPRSHRIVFYTERSAAELVLALPGIAASGSRHAFMPHVYFDTDAREQPIPWRERAIDLLYVGSYQDPGPYREAFAQKHPDRRGLLDHLIDAALFDYRTPFWRTAEKLAAERGVEARNTNVIYLDMLVAANQFIRNERRRRLLEKLARYPMYLVWSGPRPAIALHPDTRVADANKIPETLALCENAKAMAMCLNNFPYSLSERLLSAMHRGAAVVCNPNSLIEEAFVPEKDILLWDTDGDLARQMDLLKDAQFAEALTASARAKVVRDFSPDLAVDRFIESILAHRAR